MKIDLFSIPIWIGNIEASKIEIKNKESSPTFLSDIKTNFDSKNIIDKEAVQYLYQTIVKLLDEKITSPYTVELQHIWENHYEEADFQEAHTHPNSDFSFIIYKKINESRTVFLSPFRHLLGSYYFSCSKKQDIMGGEFYMPECRENQIIIFPSFLEHCVKKTSNATTIAGNFRLTFN